MRSQILVFSGQGVSSYYLKHVVKWLKEALPLGHCWEIRRVDGDFLITDLFWEKVSKLLIIPGGADIPYHRVLHGIGTSRIYQFVHGGGNFLGICAGAYFGCQSFEFTELSGSHWIGTRDLGFFPGRAIGPAYGNDFSYTTPIGVRAARMFFTESQQEGWALFNGGCFFERADSYPSVTVEARYQDIKGQPASIVSRRIGKGLAVLSGVHLEYLPHLCHLKEPNVVDAREKLIHEAYSLNSYREWLLYRLLST